MRCGRAEGEHGANRLDWPQSWVPGDGLESSVELRARDIDEGRPAELVIETKHDRLGESLGTPLLARQFRCQPRLSVANHQKLVPLGERRFDGLARATWRGRVILPGPGQLRRPSVRVGFPDGWL